MNIKKNKKGITLIEIIIVVAIIGILIPAISSVFFTGTKSFQFSKDKGFAQQEARYAATYITRAMRTAQIDSVTANDPGGTREVIDASDFDGVSSIEFSVQTDESGNVTDHTTLLVSLTAEEDNAHETAEFKVRMENVQNLESFKPNDDGTPHVSLYYKKY